MTLIVLKKLTHLQKIFKIWRRVTPNNPGVLNLVLMCNALYFLLIAGYRMIFHFQCSGILIRLSKNKVDLIHSLWQGKRARRTGATG